MRSFSSQDQNANKEANQQNIEEKISEQIKKDEDFFLPS